MRHTVFMVQSIFSIPSFFIFIFVVWIIVMDNEFGRQVYADRYLMQLFHSVSNIRIFCFCIYLSFNFSSERSTFFSHLVLVSNHGFEFARYDHQRSE